ncbi:TPA: hypothetical protein O9783_002754 [Staphylococcus aureus]|nr:hypothetical protein [Staphylococcus aureus]
MRISDGKKVIINYVSKTDKTDSKVIFNGTYGELRKIHGENFNGFSERDSFMLGEERVKNIKMITSHPASPDSIKDEYFFQPF